MIDIRRCTSQDLPALMAFIDCHWREGHVLATSRPIMDWQHGAEDDQYNYLLALQGSKLLGVLGYIPTKRYDPTLSESNVLWLALWKIRDDCKLPGLGLRMLGALEKIEPNVAIAVNGINPAYLPLYRVLGYRMLELAQHYAVNPSHLPRLLMRESNIRFPRLSAGHAVSNELNEQNILDFTFTPTTLPRKTARYFLERFLRHPFYHYRVFHLAYASQHALIATRVASHGDDRALRIVDFSGDITVFAESGSAIAAILHEENAEYVDFWEYGMPSDALKKVGFDKVEQGGGVTVPNFFEPFVAKNGRISCAIKTRDTAPCFISRADGDQDRPNTMHVE
jgi:hypothetical protein